MSDLKPALVQITAENYHRFQALVNWRITGNRRTIDLPHPTVNELVFASREGFWVWAAEIEGELVGWIGFVLIPKPDSRVGMIYVDELWTANEFRRRGVAKLLMEKAIETARELQLWKVRLYVGKDNPAARGFYKKMGFVEDDTEAMFCNYGGRLD
ncbi:MAG: GNAT family N-acetyltransferase [Bacillota bacterium]|nr:GNAT family N-acetyltransferase [Bacillota bacterium]